MTNRINLRDVTFLIPIRVESIDRLENLVLCVNYLRNEFDCNIHVLETSSLNTGFVQQLLNNMVDYTFIQDKDPIFYKTKYLNIMTRGVNTPILSTWDADVIVPVNQMIDAVNSIKSGNADFAFPYDGNFFDTGKIIKDYYYEKQDIDILIRNKGKMNLIYGDKMVGGAVIAKTSSYIEAGMETEEIYGWGPEDFERYERWKLLDYKIYKTAGCMFHLYHSRTSNSRFRTSEQVIRSNKSFTDTSLSSKEELLRKLDTKSTTNLK